MENKLHSEQDALAQAFRDKLAHHSIPVDSSAWEAIQSRLNAAGAAAAQQAGGATGLKAPQTKAEAPAGKKRRAAIWWISVSAAASLALLLTFGWLYQQQQEPAQESTAILSPSPTTNQPTASGEMQLSAPTVERSMVINKASVVSQLASLESVPAIEEPVPALEQPVPVVEINDKETRAVDSSIDTQEAGKKPEVEKDKPSKLNELVPVTTSAEDWTKHLQVKKSRPMLAAALGSGFSAGGPTGSGGLYMDAMSESFLSNSGRPMRAKALSAADFDKKEYLPPLSAGVKIRFASKGQWAFETGLQYTFLHTKLSYEQWTGNTAEMKLHYLGLPLGLAFTITDSPRWQLYLSGGVLVEKGLQSVYDEYRDWGSAVFNTHVSKGIDGLQWSLYSAMGAGYHLDKNMMLYFEPQLSYFFDSNQPISVRTEQPLMLGLTAGIRFSF